MNLTLLVEDFGHYLNAFNPLDYQGWLYLLLITMAFWILSKIALFFFKRNVTITDEDQPSTQQLIYRSHVRAYSLLTGFLFILYCIYWRNAYYKDNPYQFIHLVSFLLLGIALVTTLWQWSKLVSSQKVKELYNAPYTRNEAIKRYELIIQSFKLSRLWILLPVLAFLILPFLQKKSYNLISIVIDTSLSMGAPNANGEIPLENGKKALSRTLGELNETNDLVITIFSAGSSFKNTLGEILAIRNESNLVGTNTFFDGTEINAAINYINGLKETSDYSPIIETIWKNFLFTEKQAKESKTYDNIVSIIITDGIELPEVEKNRFFCSNDDYITIFSESKNVNIINLLGDNNSNSFFTAAIECGYTVQDGFTADTYSASMEEILEDYKSNWSFIIWMSSIVIIITLVSLLIYPNYNRI